MECIYGTIIQDNKIYENLKTVDIIHSNLSGYFNSVKEFSDGTKIKDRCHIIKKYASKESDDLCYDWYLIENHYRETDISAKTQKMVDKVSATLDYISMMSGIDIPKEDGGNNE